jgi:DNA end-binding protein Ku
MQRGAIYMKVHCPEHGEVKRSDMVRGHEWSKGRYVVLDESGFEAVPLKTGRAIEIEQFVPARCEDAGVRFVEHSYYLEPEPVGRKAFGLLKTVLAESELQAVCKIVLKDRELRAALDPFGPTVLLSTPYWPDEVHDAADLDIPAKDLGFKPAEIEMARQVVETLSGDFEATRYKDEYREDLMQVIDSRIAAEPEATEAPISVSKARQRRARKSAASATKAKSNASTSRAKSTASTQCRRTA